MEVEPSYHTLEDFKFESGEVLKELRMEYTTMGNAERDGEGKITNALLFLHGWSGDYGSFKRFLDFTNPGEPFDKDKYFIIATTALGSPGSAAPSTSSLGKDFPEYSIGDMVNVQYRLIKEHLNVDHLKCVIGTSLGGFQSLMWGVSYPEFMDSIINIVTGPAALGRNLALFQVTNNIILDDPSYMNGEYQDNPVDAVKNINELMFMFAFTVPYYHEAFPSKESLFEALQEQGTEGKTLDARDVIWRNNAAISFDLRDQLNKTRAKSLIIGIEGDQYFPPEIDAEILSELIEDSKLFIFKSDLGHLGINEIEKMKDAIVDFLND
ncbi:MAG: alpha/beta fold hydrolase [Methanothermobacter sp.]